MINDLIYNVIRVSDNIIFIKDETLSISRPTHSLLTCLWAAANARLHDPNLVFDLTFWKNQMESPMIPVPTNDDIEAQLREIPFDLWQEFADKKYYAQQSYGSI